MKYKKILLKLSGETLGGKKESGIDFHYLSQLVEEVMNAKSLGVSLALVLGGGNFWRYRDFKDSSLERVHSDQIGMLATIMNGLALQDALRQKGISAQALSAFEVGDVMETYSREKALQLMKEGIVVICVGGTGRPFFTTDTAAVLRALELDCDVVLKGTKVDYVYDKDPMQFPDAQYFEVLSYTEVLDKSLQVMDLPAIALCQDNTLPVIVFNFFKKGNLSSVLQGKSVGTLIS